MAVIPQPQLFALCEITDALEHQVVAWGMEFTDGAVLFWYHGGKPRFGMFDSADRAERFLGRLCPVHIERVIAEPS
jgi:hypothetical protein